MKKKFMSLALATILVASALLVGCQGSSTSQESPKTEAGSKNNEEAKTTDGDVTEISFWTLSTRQDAVEAALLRFNAENPDVVVTASYYDTDGVKDACKVAASSNTLPNMWFNWGGALGSFYTENGLTYDLTEFAATNGWSDKFLESALGLCTFDGQLAGYPTSFNVLGTYYRKDIFEQHNLAEPTTFEEFEAVCAKLKENGITPISTAGLYGWHVMRVVELFIEHYAGEEMHDKLGSFQESWDCQPVIQALTKYQEFCEKGYFPDGFITADPNDTNMAVFQGMAAMDVQGQWWDGTIIQNGQDMNNFDVFALPTGGTNRFSSFAEMVQFNAHNSEKEIEACVRFLNFYQSPDFVAEYAEYYNLPLPIIGAAMPEGQPNVAKLMEMSQTNGTFTITDQAFPPEVADVLFGVQEAIAGNTMTPTEGAKAIQAGIEAYQAK